MKPATKPEALVLYATFVQADRMRRDALAAGDSREDADAIVANALKVAWPKGRSEPWRYICDDCCDTGWEARDCSQTRCQRRQEHAPHTYVEPCWCAKGRAKIAGPAQEADELAAVGKTKTRRPSRFGGF